MASASGTKGKAGRLYKPEDGSMRMKTVGQASSNGPPAQESCSCSGVVLTRPPMALLLKNPSPAQACSTDALPIVLRGWLVLRR